MQKGMFKLPLEVKTVSQGKKMTCEMVLIREERRRKKRMSMGEAYSSCVGMMLVLKWGLGGRLEV